MAAYSLDLLLASKIVVVCDITSKMYRAERALNHSLNLNQEILHKPTRCLFKNEKVARLATLF